MAALIVVSVAMLAAWFLFDRSARAERDSADARVDALLATLNADRADHTRMLENLCQRIQAPEAAVVDHQIQGMPFSPPAINLDVDEDFMVSKEDLADQWFAQEQTA